MPIYSYECPVCKTIEDKIFNPNERPEKIKMTCCLCGSTNVEFVRIVTSPSGFRLKGEGFYKKTSTFD